MNTPQVHTHTIGTGPLLGVLFVALKLTGVIHWSWWFVTLPFWIVPAGLLLVAAVLAAIAIGAGLFGVLFAWTARRK